ncbi:F-box protein SKIP8 [Cardamine amara subsp. amara]|uniref:F-box protein SKIP8 n=1 Tax=Cardamine amara subsp. amara TaxID=228776 RepID=A0ABD1BZD2_CARAN
MTSYSMWKAANDDKLWKSLYHKEFTEKHVNVNPVNGWKAHYAATKAVIDVKYEFFNIIVSRSLDRMASLWLNADQVQCIDGEHFSGYDAVMRRWEFCFDNWPIGYDLEDLDVQFRIQTTLACVTTHAIDHVIAGLFRLSNVFQLHNGRWLLVHHHGSYVPPHQRC